MRGLVEGQLRGQVPVSVSLRLARGRETAAALLRAHARARDRGAGAFRDAGDGGRAAAGGGAALHDAVRAGISVIVYAIVGAGSEDGPGEEQRAAGELSVRAGRGGTDRGQRESRGHPAAIRASAQASSGESVESSTGGTRGAEGGGEGARGGGGKDIRERAGMRLTNQLTRRTLCRASWASSRTSSTRT